MKIDLVQLADLSLDQLESLCGLLNISPVQLRNYVGTQMNEINLLLAELTYASKKTDFTNQGMLLQDVKANIEFLTSRKEMAETILSRTKKYEGKRYKNISISKSASRRLIERLEHVEEE